MPAMAGGAARVRSESPRAGGSQGPPPGAEAHFLSAC